MVMFSVVYAYDFGACACTRPVHVLVHVRLLVCASACAYFWSVGVSKVWRAGAGGCSSYCCYYAAAIAASITESNRS